MTETTVQALGRSVEGDIQHYGSSGPGEQVEPTVFLEALDALLAHPQVEKVQWYQYTPYFNDGEACTFGLGDPFVKILGLKKNWTDYDEDLDAEDFDFATEGDSFYAPGWAMSLVDINYGADWSKRVEKPKIYEGLALDEIVPLWDTFCAAFYRSEIFLRASFGDPATVFALPDGSFRVEDYEHE